MTTAPLSCVPIDATDRRLLVPMKEIQQVAEPLLTLRHCPMAFLSMPSAAGHRLDLGHIIGGIRDLHDQPSPSPGLTRTASGFIAFPQLFNQLQGILTPSALPGFPRNSRLNVHIPL
ncbi:MAG: hypothetical protein AB7P17_13940 [Nitrospirales bacterium]